MISFLWAQDENGLIGNNNELPWRLPADLKYFKETTMGRPIVMGRKTYESIGRPLPGRTNIILTRDTAYTAEGCLVFHSKEDLLDWIEENGPEVFITGGSEIFKLFLNHVDRLYVTKIRACFEGDTYFPEIDWEKWRLKSAEKGPKDDKNPYDYEFQIYERD
ncbi:dihydrofolate reductase [Siminovitchia acidinfaciens]|uniref:Dihydrofolate reductase n=1 Tax=Siminovitchia acidinfaciens TaxID=2321395 RepID=A0A429XWT2_9BACI|nr:dihydrofolate reductase [Siminovitchia acidinfaciens]RST72952.1 dihydrofolate reductase [Siminovitchia acidinfaciens]